VAHLVEASVWTINCLTRGSCCSRFVGEQNRTLQNCAECIIIPGAVGKWSLGWERMLVIAKPVTARGAATCLANVSANDRHAYSGIHYPQRSAC
jgi:hypothetical protein